VPRRKIPDPAAVRIGARLRDLRLERRMSLENVAAACGVPRGHLSSIERGLVVMNIVTLVRIATALKVNMAHVFCEEEG
jgi:transcriptional regulator with XRE-family HTH domain